jgi:hypothetical protein
MGLKEALPGLCVGVATIGDTDFARRWLSAIQRLAAMTVSDLQMGETTAPQVVDAVDPPVGSLAGRFAEAAAVSDAQDSPRASRVWVSPAPKAD